MEDTGKLHSLYAMNYSFCMLKSFFFYLSKEILFLLNLLVPCITNWYVFSLNPGRMTVELNTAVSINNPQNLALSSTPMPTRQNNDIFTILKSCKTLSQCYSC